MNDDNTQGDAEPSPASVGSVANSVASQLAAWRDERGYPTPGEMMDEAAQEIERLRLTDSERFVLREVRDIYADEDDVKCNEIAAVIDGLLERTK
jgi:hypothetical protein